MVDCIAFDCMRGWLAELTGRPGGCADSMVLMAFWSVLGIAPTDPGEGTLACRAQPDGVNALPSMAVPV